MVSRTLAGCPNCHYRPAWTWLDDTICDVSGQVEYVCGLLGSWVQHCVIIHQFFSEKQSIWCVSPDLRGRQWNSFILWLPWRHAIWILLWDLLGRPQSMLWWIGKCGLPSREEPWFWINATATGWGCEAMSTIQSTGNNWKLQQSKDFLFCLPLIRVYIYICWFLMILEHWCTMLGPGKLKPCWSEKADWIVTGDARPARLVFEWTWWLVLIYFIRRTEWNEFVWLIWMFHANPAP